MGFFDKLKNILGITPSAPEPKPEFKPVSLKEFVIEKAPAEDIKVEIPLEVKLEVKSEEKPKKVKKQGPKKAPRVPRAKKTK